MAKRTAASAQPWAKDDAPVSTVDPSVDAGEENPDEGAEDEGEGDGEGEGADDAENHESGEQGNTENDPPAPPPPAPEPEPVKPTGKKGKKENPAIQPADDNEQAMAKKARVLLKVGDHMPQAVLHLISRGMTIADAIEHYNNRDEE